MLRQEHQLGQVQQGFCGGLPVLNANALEIIEVLDAPERHLLAVNKRVKYTSVDDESCRQTRPSYRLRSHKRYCGVAQRYFKGV
jgi:hypothetical protein